MNHIEVEIGGKKRTLRFGLKTIGDCVKHQGQDPEMFLLSLTKNPFESIPAMIYYGAKYEVEKNKGVADFVLLDVYEWVEDEGITSDKIDSISRVFTRSLYDNVPYIKELLDLPENEELKKNLIGIETS